MAVPKRFAVGIDLGTCITNACIWFPEGIQPVECEPIPGSNYNLPSIVAVQPNGDFEIGYAVRSHESAAENTLYDSKRMLGKNFLDPDIQRDIKAYAFKVVDDGGKPKYEVTLGNNTQSRYSPREICSILLKKIKEFIEAHLGTAECQGVVLTCPAFFKEPEKDELRLAAETVGLEVLRFLPEPVAAALEYYRVLSRDNFAGFPSGSSQNVAIFDYGGGTFDVCIIKITVGNIEVQSLNGIAHCGGQDLDLIVASYFAAESENRQHVMVRQNAAAFEKLRRASEEAKIKLSDPTVTEVPINIDPFISTRAFNSVLTRDKFNSLCDKEFDRCIDCLKRAIADAGLKEAQIDKVLLVGGSSSIPRVQEKLAEIFGEEKIDTTIPAFRAVSQGAALQAAMIQHLDSTDITSAPPTVVPHTLGIRYPVKGERFFLPVLPRGTSIPSKQRIMLHNWEAQQKEMHIELFFGEDQDVSRDIPLETLTLEITPAPLGESNVELSVQIDKQGRLRVTAEDQEEMNSEMVVVPREKIPPASDPTVSYTSVALENIPAMGEGARLATRNQFEDLLKKLHFWFTRDPDYMRWPEVAFSLLAVRDALEALEHESPTSPPTKTEYDVQIERFRDIERRADAWHRAPPGAGDAPGRTGERDERIVRLEDEVEALHLELSHIRDEIAQLRELLSQRQ